VTIRVEVERLVLHDFPLAHTDRRGLLAAVEQAIAEQMAAAAAGWDIVGGAVPVIRTNPITLAGGEPAGTPVDALADGIAAAATSAVGQLRGGKP